MEHEMKHLYGRRITPGVKIFILIVTVFLGLGLAFTESVDADKKSPETEVVE
jgi:hypothetical protein